MELIQSFFIKVEQVNENLFLNTFENIENINLRYSEWSEDGYTKY